MIDINLLAIIEKYGLDKNALGRVLYPDNTRPDMALKRVIDGGSSLDSKQVYELSLHCGCSVNELYGIPEDYKIESTTSNSITLQNDKYKAAIDTSTMVLRVYDLSGIELKIVAINQKTITLIELTETLNNLLK